YRKAADRIKPDWHEEASGERKLPDVRRHECDYGTIRGLTPPARPEYTFLTHRDSLLPADSHDEAFSVITCHTYCIYWVRVRARESRFRARCAAHPFGQLLPVPRARRESTPSRFAARHESRRARKRRPHRARKKHREPTHHANRLDRR